MGAHVLVSRPSACSTLRAFRGGSAFSAPSTIPATHLYHALAGKGCRLEDWFPPFAPRPAAAPRGPRVHTAGQQLLFCADWSTRSTRGPFACIEKPVCLSRCCLCLFCFRLFLCNFGARRSHTYIISQRSRGALEAGLRGCKGTNDYILSLVSLFTTARR